MPIRELLPSILRGDTASDLGPESRARLEEVAHDAQREGAVVALRDECAARLRQPQPPHAVEYLLAAACALNGEIERAHQTLLTVGEKLAAERAWEPLAAVADRALQLEETQAAARLLVRAHEGLGRDPERIHALERAWGIVPDDLELGLLLAVRLGEAGEGEHRRALLTELMPRFAADSRWAGLEEAALEFVEHQELDGLVRLVDTLPAIARQGALQEAGQLLEIAFPAVSRAGRAGEVLTSLREVAAAAAAAGGDAAVAPFRPAVVEAVRQGVGASLPSLEPVLADSGLADAMKPLMPALERFDAIAALPPGRPVIHSSFGAGTVTADDGELVVIDFARSKGHRMPYAAARRTLTPLDRDDLRLLHATDPAALAKLVEQDPGEVVVRALRALGGAADAQKLKVFVVGSGLVAPKAWTSFWRRARAAAEKNPRIDHSRAFEQHYRLATGNGGTGEDELPLPALEPRKSVKSNLSTLRKFLSQHPQAEERLAQRFGRYVERAMVNEDGDRVDRARAGLYVARWSPLRAAEWGKVLRRLWDQGLSITELTGEDEQLALLEASHAIGVEADAILSALDSRFSAVRAAAGRFRDQQDEGARAELRRTLLGHATRYPTAALRRIERDLGLATAPDDAWNVLWAALSLVEERPKPSVADKVLRWLEPGGPFDRWLAGRPAPEDARLRIRVLLRQWRSSDRFLFPALEAVERLGLADEVRTARADRQRSTERLFSQVGQQAEDADLPVMTRATWERLSREMERLEKELKTTIPATIQRARELGDLRENAEYHSAKLKQANVSKLVVSLQRRLARARFVEDADHKDGVVGLGSEVVLESDDEVVTFWVLGEGEHHHGDHVVSFQAPVGRALMGCTIGDEVALGEGERRRLYRVVSIERRLPPTNGDASV